MNFKQIIENAFQEDLPQGDITTDSLALENIRGRGLLLAKEDLVLSGREIFENCITFLDPFSEFKWYFQDGQTILRGQNICIVKGEIQRLIKAERVALNFVTHLSGVATLTKCFVQRISHTKTKILDTRKTLPLYRELQKMAVVHGGGVNHRMSLSDAVMIKDNHIVAAGGITRAVEMVRARGHQFIEVEAKTLEQVKESVQLNVNQILLDNMNNDLLKKSLELIPNHIKSEASGNMNLDRVKSVAELGVSFISVGALTHSAPSADMSLKFEWDKLPERTPPYPQ